LPRPSVTINGNGELYLRNDSNRLQKLRFTSTAIFLFLAAALSVMSPAGANSTAKRKASNKGRSLQFEVGIAPGLTKTTHSGRLLVVLGRGTGHEKNWEPRFTIGDTGLETSPVLGHDVSGFVVGTLRVLDESAAIFPIASLASLPSGDYMVQAVLADNPDLRGPNAPGNLYSAPRKIHLDPKAGGTVALMLTQQTPAEQLPPDTDYLRFVKLKSELLSRFYGRTIYLRAGIILPRDYAKETDRRYPLRVHIGGYGSRYSPVYGMMSNGSGFRKAWTADDAPRMLLLHLDGAGPLGDPYQVNSANHGPFGDAITQELIPYVEQKFRGIGKPTARVLDGGSTGGWVSLALQVFYPDFFNGTWSISPDPVDFRAYELVDIHKDTNAYTNRYDFERSSMREIGGETVFTMRHECQIENVLGAGDSYTLSGGQWGAWNATFSPRGADGRPVPLWNPKTGVIDKAVAEQWKRYDLRLYLETNWRALAPKLRGKIHIWVGDADNYYLNNAVHLLDSFLGKADPPYEGSIKYGALQGHTWIDLNERQMLDQMQAAVSGTTKSGGASTAPVK